MRYHVVVSRMLLFVATLACAQLARAQEVEGLLDAPGSWRPTREPSIASNVARGPARDMLAHLDRIIAILRAAPVLVAPRGFVVVPSKGVSPGPYTIEDEDVRGFGRGPLVAYSMVMMMPLYREESGGAIRVAGEGAAFTVNVNTLKCLYPGWSEPYASDSIGGMYVQPERTEDVHGHPAYASSLGETCVVVTSRAAPLYVPVSRERLLRALIASDRIGLDSASVPNTSIAEMLRGARELQHDTRPEIRKQGREMEARIKAQAGAIDTAHATATATYRNRMTAHEQLLAKLSASERAAPAVVRNLAMADDPFTADPDHPFAPTALVTPNPEFFVRTRAPSDVQVLTLLTDCKAIMCSAWGNQVRAQLLGELNWAALEAATR